MSGSAGSAGSAGNNSAGATSETGSGGLPICGSEDSTAGEGGQGGEEQTAVPYVPYGFDFSAALTNGVAIDGQITVVAEDRLEITADGGAWTFWWTGPALASHFAVGNAVRFGRWGLGIGGMGYQMISIVRSESATAAAIDGRPYSGFGTSPGDTLNVPDRPGFPELIYHMVSCCAFPAPPPGEACDYSRLETRFDGASTFIDYGQTGEVGPWTVANLGSSAGHSGESTWIFKASLLGPATPEEPAP